MDQAFDISRLLALRSLTTPLAELFARRARDHLADLAPLLSPRALFGDLILGEKNAVKGSNLAFQELNALYQPVAKSATLGLQSDLRPPLEIFGLTPEIFPASYSYTARPQQADHRDHAAQMGIDLQGSRAATIARTGGQSLAQ